MVSWVPSRVGMVTKSTAAPAEATHPASRPNEQTQGRRCIRISRADPGNGRQNRVHDTYRTTAPPMDLTRRTADARRSDRLRRRSPAESFPSIHDKFSASLAPQARPK